MVGQARHGRCGKPRVVFNIFVASRRGVIMRGRKRSRLWPAHADDGFPPARADDDMDAATEEGLRALARLLAPQAAREAFAQSITHTDAGRTRDEGLE